jgi:hypothetical protein
MQFRAQGNINQGINLTGQGHGSVNSSRQLAKPLSLLVMLTRGLDNAMQLRAQCCTENKKTTGLYLEKHFHLDEEATF